MWNIHDLSAFEKRRPKYVRAWYLANFVREYYIHLPNVIIYSQREWERRRQPLKEAPLELRNKLALLTIVSWRKNTRMMKIAQLEEIMKRTKKILMMTMVQMKIMSILEQQLREHHNTWATNLGRRSSKTGTRSSMKRSISRTSNDYLLS